MKINVNYNSGEKPLLLVASIGNIVMSLENKTLYMVRFEGNYANLYLQDCFRPLCIMPKDISGGSSSDHNELRLDASKWRKVAEVNVDVVLEAL